MRLAHRALLNLASALARSPLRARAPVAAQMGLSRETLALDAPDIAILGGGFGGLYTALRLSSLDWGDRPRPHVTLIDRSDRFVFLPMLYELATGATAAWEVAPLFEDILAGSGITFVQGEVRALDKAARLVEVAGVRSPGAGSEPTIQRVAYDACVVALGSEPSPASLPGAERALPFYSFKDATVLRQRLQTKRADTTTPLRIAIVGGGYIGVELAANLARWGKSVRGSSSPSVDLTLIHRADCIMSNSAEFSRQVAQGELSEIGVQVITDTAVVEITEDSVRLCSAGADPSAESFEIPADLVLWAAGSRPSSLLPSLQIPLDPNGQVVTDRFMRVAAAEDGVEKLFALGDAAKCGTLTGSETPSTAQAAMQQADYVAWNVRASLQNDKLLPFRYQDLGEMLSLGEDSAAVSSLGLLKVKGSAGSNLRRAIYAARMPTTAQAAKVGLSWATDAAFGVLRKALQPK